TANHIGIPDVIDSQSHRDPMRATVDPYIGGGGDKKDYLQMIRSFTPTPPPTTEQRELSLKILLHPAIAMSRTFAQAIAARFSPRSILDRCQVYSADHGAGRVNGVGLLIHRFAHAADRPIRQVQYDEPFDCEWYSEMNYLVEVDEGLWDEEEQMDVAPVEEPVARSALVQTAALAAPETVEAVFNTLEIEEPSETSTETRAETKEEKVDDVTRARDVELRDLEDELRVRLQDRRVHIEQDEYDAVRGKYQAIRRQRRRIEEMWSDERWHERARSARESGERFVDVLADLVAQRWPDFPYQIEWGLRLEKMAEAYKQVGRRGKELLDDILTASASEDKNMALMLLMAQWLTPDEETSDDDHDNLQRSAIPRVPAGQAHVPALQEAEIAESVPRPQRERRRPHPAVQGVP
ncbi:MAG: hypothetical protein OXG44_01550, partial [Gammaproteobacteria bacterium]|nr:hypothetical protein [Gammaproteobacteria bacterium]